MGRVIRNRTFSHIMGNLRCMPSIRNYLHEGATGLLRGAAGKAVWQSAWRLGGGPSASECTSSMHTYQTCSSTLGHRDARLALARSLASLRVGTIDGKQEQEWMDGGRAPTAKTAT